MSDEPCVCGTEFMCMADDHSPYQLDIRWQAGWREWRADCSCGWIGSYFPSNRKVLAEDEARKHKALVHPASRGDSSRG